jgi:hypothetical protein
MAGKKFRDQLRSRKVQTDGTVAVLSDANRDTCPAEMLSRHDYVKKLVAQESCAVDVAGKRWRRRLCLEESEPLDY